MMQRRRVLAAIIGLAMFAGGCAPSPVRADYAAERPQFELEKYFNGAVTAHGIFSDRSGKVVRRFTVAMNCNWTGSEGVLDEDFTYSDGKTERRTWRITKTGPGRYSGEAAGNALNWRYTLRLPGDGKVYDVAFDDWMFQIDEHVVLNRAMMSKFGIHLGEVTRAFRKR